MGQIGDERLRQLAWQLLDVLALLKPAGVRRVWLNALDSKDQVEKALALLEKSSLATVSESRMSVAMPRPVAQAVQAGHADQGRLEKAVAATATVLESAAQALKPSGPTGPALATLTQGEATDLAAHVRWLLAQGGPAAQNWSVIKAGNLCGVALNQVDSPRDAIAIFKTMVSAAKGLGGQAHPETLTLRHNMAMSFHLIGRSNKAIRLFKAVVAMRTRVLGPDHPDTLAAKNNLAYVYGASGRVAKAIRLHEAALADTARVLGPDHPDTLRAQHNLSGAYYSAGRVDEAADLLQAVLAGRERALGRDHPETRRARNNLSMLSGTWQGDVWSD
jgi:tetratricopeptide (TPR) repeat protein